MKTETIIEYTVNWLKTYATNAGCQGFVIGISGGIDSAVASVLCAQTGLDVLCIELPIHQPESHLNRGKQHILDLKNTYSNVRSKQVDLTELFDGFKISVQAEELTPKVALALANTRSRLRMTTLYYYAGLDNLLVAGTGNKIEDFGVGFFTKYGDGGVDLSPLGDLMKSEVYELAKALNISSAIIDAAPSDGLFGDDRSDEDQIGASYPELEWAMSVSDQGQTIADFSGRQAEVMTIYTRLNRINQHKMNPIPVCIIPENLK